MVSMRRNTHIVVKTFATENSSKESCRVIHTTLGNLFHTLFPLFVIYRAHILVVYQHRVRAAVEGNNTHAVGENLIRLAIRLDRECEQHIL